MTAFAARPLLFLDVDGPLIPFGAGPYPHGAGANPLLARIDPALGPRLAALPCELVWATTWEDEANECIAPRLGLPQLPLVAWPEPSDEDGQGGVHWKTPALLAHAAGRDFVWVDDEITGADRAWVAARHPGRALLHRVDPGRGLTEADFGALWAWCGRQAQEAATSERSAAARWVAEASQAQA
ncbi:HAD domain-containing protein [Streptomyces sp. NPDC057011]|uniref:HAD domain-containing protein n=1 Tax=unclassified Streptomyces TaxID=2593676 RepID=UPI00362D4B33